MQIFEKINLENIAIFLRKIRSQILQSEFIRIGSAVFFVIILALFLLPFSFNNSSLKLQIEKKVSEMLGASFVINGETRVVLLPSPTVIVKNVVLKNYVPQSGEKDGETSDEVEGKIYNLYAKEVHIQLPTFKISHDSFAKRLVFVDAILESHYGTNQAAVRSDAFTAKTEQFAKSNPNASANISDSEFSTKLFSFDDIKASNISIDNMPDFVIKNGEIVLYDKLDRVQDVKSIAAKIEISADKISARGDFISADIGSEFSFLAKFNSTSSSPQSSLKINSPVMKLLIKGNFTAKNIGILQSDFNGKINVEISELKSFYKSYISNNSVFFYKLKSGVAPIKISADVDSRNQKISIINLLVNSGVANGKGEIDLSFAKENPLVDVSLDLENLDLDSFWSDNEFNIVASNNMRNSMSGAAKYLANNPTQLAPQAVTLEEVRMVDPDVAIQPLDDQENDKSKIISTNDNSPQDEDVAQVVQNQTTVPDSTNPITTLVPAPIDSPQAVAPINLKIADKLEHVGLTVDIKIKNVKYLESEIRDANLYATLSKENKILVSPMAMTIPGEGLLKVSGVFDYSEALPKFIGKFDVKGKDLGDVFKWLKIESKNLKFENLREYTSSSDVLLLPNSIAMSNFSLNLNSGKSEFTGEIKIDTSHKTNTLTSRFRVSDFNVDDYFFTSSSSSYLSPGLLVKKLLWLNELSLNGSMDLSFDKLSYNNQNFTDQAMQINLGHGYFSIKNLTLKSDGIDAKADFLVDLSDKDARFEISVSGDSFYYQSSLQDQVVDDPSDNKDSVKKIQKQNFVDQFFDLPSLKGFDGKVAFNFKNLQLDNLKLQNAELTGSLADGVVDVSKCVFDLYGGSFNYRGSFAVSQSKSISGNFAFTNVELQQLLPNLLGINGVSGIANIAASITGSAEKKAEFVRALNSDIKFSANAPRIDNYGLNDLVKKMFQPQIYGNELRAPEKILFNNAAKTIFKQADGTIQINGGRDVRMHVSTSAQVLNGILSGKANLEDNTIDSLFSVIFLTGNRQKQIPINIATNLKGGMDSISQNTNLEQVRQYLGLSNYVSAQLPITSSQTMPQQPDRSGQFAPNQASDQSKSRIIN